jgi:two-component system sensor histidine kinase DesK
VTRISRWWQERSAAERFDISGRWPMYVLMGMPLLLVGTNVSSDGWGPVRGAVGVAVLLIGAGQATACAFLLHAGFERFLGRPARLRRLVVTATVLTVAGAAAGSVVLPDDGEPGLPLEFVLAIAFVGTLAAAVSPVLSSSQLTLIVAGAVVVAATAGAVAGGGEFAVPAAVFALFWVGFMTATYKFTAWMIGVVWELDRGRATAARLAVAEERLRFARDLHDVLGRNLSVIAVKSELAARLAERGDGAAVTELAEIRSVAHDSLREVRDVVGGYRTADLDAELAGARSVLRSAGVECRVIGDGAHLPEPVQAALGWVVREATTNVIRHSDATACTIRLDVEDFGTTATAVLRMDNDRARSASTGRPLERAGSGLAGLSERLAGVGGWLKAERRPGDRFVVEASVPVVAS